MKVDKIMEKKLIKCGFASIGIDYRSFTLGRTKAFEEIELKILSYANNEVDGGLYNSNELLKVYEWIQKLKEANTK